MVRLFLVLILMFVAPLHAIASVHGSAYKTGVEQSAQADYTNEKCCAQEKEPEISFCKSECKALLPLLVKRSSDPLILHHIGSERFLTNLVQQVDLRPPIS